MTAGRMRAVILAAFVCGAAVIVLDLTSDNPDADTGWARLWPVVGWSFIATGLYAARRRPESRVGALMVLMGFAWFLAALNVAGSPLLYSLGYITGGLWGGVFLHLVLSFPSGRLASGLDRVLATAGYLTFTVVSVPVMLFAGPHEIGCDECPANVLLIRRDPDLAGAAQTVQALLYAVLFVIVLVRLAVRWRRTGTLERLQLTPVYVCGLLAFLLVTAATAGAGDFWWAAFTATALLPIAFLGGLLRSRVAELDAELRAHVDELRASRARLVSAADTERRRLERDLHDGAQARLVGLAMLLGHARGRAEAEPERVPALLDEALTELKTSLAELRELARGIHPAALTERGLAPALETLAAKVPVPVTVDVDGTDRLPRPVAIAAYYAVSEALANVAKYAEASAATVTVRRAGDRITVDVTDDGIGGADPAHGSGLVGLADRVAALDGTLSLESPPGRGTRLRIELPCRPPT